MNMTQRVLGQHTRGAQYDCGHLSRTPPRLLIRGLSQSLKFNTSATHFPYFVNDASFCWEDQRAYRGHADAGVIRRRYRGDQRETTQAATEGGGFRPSLGGWALRINRSHLTPTSSSCIQIINCHMAPGEFGHFQNLFIIYRRHLKGQPPPAESRCCLYPCAVSSSVAATNAPSPQEVRSRFIAPRTHQPKETSAVLLSKSTF